MVNDLEKYEAQKVITDYYEKKIQNSKDKLKEIFPDQKYFSKKKINWDGTLQDICNDLLDIYTFEKIQLIIRKNKEALPLMGVLIDRAEKKHLNNRFFMNNIHEFFDLEKGKYKALLQNYSFHDVIVNNYDLGGSSNRNSKQLDVFLDLLYFNGHSKGLSYVKSLFDTDFNKYSAVIKDETRKISNAEDNVKKWLDSSLSADEFKNIKDDIMKGLKTEEGFFIKEIVREFKKNMAKNLLKDFRKIESDLMKKVNVEKKRINESKKRQNKVRNDFKITVVKYFRYYSNFFSQRIIYDDFQIDLVDHSFIEMCKSIWNFLNDYKESEKEIYEVISGYLNGIIPELLGKIIISVRGDDKHYLSQYYKLDRLFQSLYKYTSDENIKIRILEAYYNDEYAPIPFGIIKDGLNKDKFDTLDDDARGLIVTCIENRYKILTKIFSPNNFLDEYEHLSLFIERLREINQQAICNFDLPDNVRERAFNWYFDFENNNENKKKFCWKLIEEFDKTGSSELKPCDNEAYKKCENYLIEKESAQGIESKLTAIMQSNESKGVICSFIGGFAKHPDGNTSDFGSQKERYKQKLIERGLHPDFDNWNSKIWGNREPNKGTQLPIPQYQTT